MSTALEIEKAIEHLATDERAKLCDWLLAKSFAAPPWRTGAELAKLWPTLFHLTPEEAADFETDLTNSRKSQALPRPLAWE